MFVFLNGRIVPEEQAVVSVFDRSFLYGDGLFETMLVRNGKPFRWEQHLERLSAGAAFLGIRLPFSSDDLRAAAAKLIEQNQQLNALLRLTLSRGVGPRGYSPKGADQPCLVMSVHPFVVPETEKDAPRWKLIVASPRLPANEPLAHFKTCNKLTQILARAEADRAGADEALLLNTDGFVVEGSSSNFFWIEGDTLCTPPLASGILAGVTRAAILDICESLRISVEEKNILPAQLKNASGMFLSLSSWGVVEAASLDGLDCCTSPLIPRLQKAYRELVDSECGKA